MKQFVNVAILSAGAAAVHHLLVDPTQLDACNALLTRATGIKLLSVLFNSDSLSGNVAEAQAAMKSPVLWRRINSLSPAVENVQQEESGGFLTTPRNGRADCNDVEKLVEVAVAIGAGFASGEIDNRELSSTVADLVDSHIRTWNVSRLSITSEQLRERYSQRAFSTPLMTILPSCEKPSFETPSDAAYNWREAISSNGRRVTEEIMERYEKCGDCGERFVAEIAKASGVEIQPNLTKSMYAGLKARVNVLLNTTSPDELPETLGGMLGYFIRRQEKKPVFGDSSSATKHRMSSLAEDGVAILDAINNELLNGEGPTIEAIDTFYHSLGC